MIPSESSLAIFSLFYTNMPGAKLLAFTSCKGRALLFPSIGKKRKDNKILFCFVTVKLLYHGIMRGWICMGIYFNRVEFESGYRVGGSSRFTAYVPFYARQMYKLASKTAQNDIT